MTTAATCKTCGAPIIWVKMAFSDRKGPVNAEPDPVKGNLYMIETGLGTGHALVLAGALLDAARAAGLTLRTSHFATCRDAASHRKAA